MRFVVSDNSAAANLATGSRSSWNGYKMRNIIGYIYIAANKVVVFKQVFAVVNAQQNSAGNVQASSSANTNNTICFMRIIRITSCVYIALNRVLVYVAENLNGEALRFQVGNIHKNPVKSDVYAG